MELTWENLMRLLRFLGREHGGMFYIDEDEDGIVVDGTICRVDFEKFLKEKEGEKLA